MTDRQYASGDLVQHAKFGTGTVRADMGATILIRFSHGVEECERESLKPIETALQALTQDEWHRPQEVIARVQSQAIVSTNDAWGVFSRSRIQLLPHQLWVCRRVLERWPARWLVADDVGLGKTIEAGLILWPLLSRGRVARLLVLCPASLVEQWQERLREMFDIRVVRYSTEQDTPRSDFWNSNPQVVASIQTLRKDLGNRQERLIESDPWDLVMVDEAHHLNADEESGPTLGYKLVKQLDDARRVQSMVFFTGTPHRGKDFGFWALLQLLRPDLFDPRQPSAAQLKKLSQVMIRNNKQNVTDLTGTPLFQAPSVGTETYAYSEPEARFYRMLTDFITRGEAYASALSGSNGRAVVLVLIAMQKLASSSVAAIRRALKRRLNGILEAQKRLADQQLKRSSERPSGMSEYDEATSSNDLDRVSELEEQMAEDWGGLALMSDEEPRLRQLIEAAETITDETKMKKIIDILGERFRGRPVLFFTEYKATQSLLMSSLIREFGDGCVTFINGDERAEEVIDAQRRSRTLNERRDNAAQRFNSGAVRFLVSTEAGGEGIDLQESCHTLIHVDLPWNPMRMHQRVGRLNRYGQSKRVEVISLRNPDTVEALIWDKLNLKIGNIMTALGEVMDEPEDLLQLVLGMTSPSVFRELFAEAHSVPKEGISSWFDRKTVQFGGKDVIQTVKDLVGNAAKFDYQRVAAQIPAVDLEDLKPFFRLMVGLNNRQVREDEGRVSFKTPDAWLGDPVMRPNYEDLIFDRSDRSREAAKRVVGVGHRAFEQALRQAGEYTASVTAISRELLPSSLFAFEVSDRVTTGTTMVRSMTIGVDIPQGGQPILLADWELLTRLNGLLARGGTRRLRSSAVPPKPESVEPCVDLARQTVEKALPTLDLPFRMPVVAPVAVLWSTAEAPTDVTGTERESGSKWGQGLPASG